ncbi:bifunctional metallophosphatase/5'-nucleotidase [Photobacterium phosphoreum]|uniref:bifunctional metallophosphatase/5'-nucleotidase n=1 Tax=Photobacterium phosphoreum TaxID=659 RepID=UPI000D16602D|nr:bifunctional metallophosphatase/5'-nucleotidase [Photobacterium phosphoreum]PSU62103.1 bifunctional metallophosphatase/5'-nucleotidase [Photobacterium phosphoreum]
MFSKPILALSITLALSGSAYAASISNHNDFTLTVAHINDTHSHFDPVKSSFSANGVEVFNEFGGYPRLQAMVKTYKAQAQTSNQSLLFLGAGDAFQGSAYFKINQGAMNADLLNQMGLDGMALGNHEFDLNNQKLNTFISSLNFPIIATNVDVSHDANFNGQTNILPYRIFAFDGDHKTIVKNINKLPKGKKLVAVFGLVLQDMPNIAPHTGDVKFLNEVKTAQSTVDFLKSKGIDDIIALTHIGNATDVALAAQVNGIDLIVGGHSHTLLGDFTNIGWSNNGPYAQMVTNPDGKAATCIVQAGKYAEAMGKVSVSFNDQGQVTSCVGHNTLLSNNVFYHKADRKPQDRFTPAQTAKVDQFIAQQKNIVIINEDPQLRHEIDTKYKPAVEKAYGKIIAQVPTEITHERRPGDSGANDKHGSQVAPLIAESQYYWANLPQVQRVTGKKVDFALIGAGGIRTNINEGEYREGNASLEMLPFSNFLSVVSLKGSTVKQLLQQTITATLPEGAHAGKYPYGGHLRYTFVETAVHKAGHLTDVDVMTGTEKHPVWTPLQDNKIYNVVINNYNATGNDGWTPIFNAQKEHSNRIDLIDVDGKLVGYKVKNIKQVDDKYQVIYQGAAPNCKAANTVCNTDAQAFIDYAAQARHQLVPLAYSVVTLDRITSK